MFSMLGSTVSGGSSAWCNLESVDVLTVIDTYVLCY